MFLCSNLKEWRLIYKPGWWAPTSCKLGVLKIIVQQKLDGGFEICLFSSLFGENSYFQMGWNHQLEKKPPPQLAFSVRSLRGLKAGRVSESKSEIAKAGKATKGEIPRDLLKPQHLFQS